MISFFFLAPEKMESFRAFLDDLPPRARATTHNSRSSSFSLILVRGGARWSRFAAAAAASSSSSSSSAAPGFGVSTPSERR